MQSTSGQNLLFNEIEVNNKSYEDLDVILDLKQCNEPSPGPEIKLNQVIKNELDYLSGQLEKINNKLKTNYDSILLKQVENDEMRKVIDFYSLNTESKSPKASACGCGNNCSIY